MKVSVQVCSKCPYSTISLFGVKTNILRCSVCKCIIKLKAQIDGECPKFDKVSEMVVYKKSLKV